VAFVFSSSLSRLRLLRRRALKPTGESATRRERQGQAENVCAGYPTSTSPPVQQFVSNSLCEGLSFYEKPPLAIVGQAVGSSTLFPAFTFAHLALCAAAIFLRAVGELFERPRSESGERSGNAVEFPGQPILL
jgi:hypothetical protein